MPELPGLPGLAPSFARLSLGLDGLVGEVELLPLPVPLPVAELPVPPVFGCPCLSPGGQPSAPARSAAATSPFHPFRSVMCETPLMDCVCPKGTERCADGIGGRSPGRRGSQQGVADLSGSRRARKGRGLSSLRATGRRRAGFSAGAPAGPLASGLRWREVERAARPRTRSEKEHAMMFAFALALVGVVVLGSLQVAAARAR